MRVKLADHVADDTGAFFVARGRVEAQLVHRMQDAPVHRLQPVAHIGQRARHDRRERIGEIALAERIGKIDVADLTGKSRHGHRPITSEGSAGQPISRCPLPHPLGEARARRRQRAAVRQQHVVQ